MYDMVRRVGVMQRDRHRSDYSAQVGRGRVPSDVQ